jgi:ribosomal protein L40E
LRDASRYIFLGFILVVAGILIIMIGSFSQIGGSVYIFPFFFFSTSTPIPAFIIIIMALATLGYFYYVSKQVIVQNTQSMNSDSICPECGAHNLRYARHCSVCGASISTQMDEFQ